MSAADPAPGVLGLVVSAAGGIDQVREHLVAPALRAGWRVAVTATPTAATWLDADGERARLEAATGYPVRDRPRLPGQVSPHPPVDRWAVVPASAGTVAKMALGLSDNQALTHLCEAMGVPGVPVVVFPRVNAAHVAHPAWPGHLAALRRAGAVLVDDPAVWTPRPPGEPDADRPLPWPAIRSAVLGPGSA